MKKNFNLKGFCSLFIFLLLFFSGNAHDSLTKPVKTDSATSKITDASDLDDLIINRYLIQSLDLREGPNHSGKSGIAMLGDTLVLKVKNLDAFLERKTFGNPIILYINKLPFKSMIGLRNIKYHDEFIFILDRSSEDNENWNKVLRSGFRIKSFNLNIGMQDESIVSNNSVGIGFELRTTLEFIPFVLLILLLLVTTWYLVFKKGLLLTTVGGVQTYSLSTTHLFFWTAILLTSYMVIWWSCDDINSIDSSNLILIGISVATTSAGTIINSGNKNNNNILTASSGYKSKGFVLDLFSENNAVSIDRYQLIVFNLVVGVFFIYRVLSELTMPVLDPTLLTLLGISSAAYASVKAVKTTKDPGTNPAPENPTPPNNTPPTDTPPNVTPPSDTPPAS